MSYQRPQSRTCKLDSPEPRLKRAPKGGHPARSRHKPRVSRRRAGTTGQTLGRLASFFKMRGLSLAAGAFALIVASIWFLPTRRASTPADLLHGYLESVPPAEFYVPGMINTVEVRSDGKIALHPTCKIDAGLLTKITIDSRTVDHTLAEQLKKKFDVSGRIQELVSMEIEGNKTKKINVSLLNSRILHVPDEQLMLLQREVIKGTCQEVIERHINSGAKVCQTRAALRGDLVYDIIYEEGISAGEQAKLTGDIAARLGVEVIQGQAARMRGKDLIYGVKFGRDGILLNTPNAKPTECQTHSLMAAASA